MSLIRRALFELYLAECRKAWYSEIVLRAQLYAVPFYEALGFEKVSGVIERDGLRVVEMVKEIS